MLEYEKKWQSLGKKLIAGVDEAGRGPLAGPVVTACVIMPTDDIIVGVNDSKKLTDEKRRKLYPIIKEKAISYKIVAVNEKKIDEINILEATKLGMSDAINNLSVKPDIVLVDAVKGLKTDIEIESIIKGDALSYTIGCASILAKVYRDDLMIELDKKYPKYNFKKHKGYGTKEHINNLKEYGACEIHRKTFIKNFTKRKDNV